MHRVYRRLPTRVSGYIRASSFSTLAFPLLNYTRIIFPKGIFLSGCMGLLGGCTCPGFGAAGRRRLDVVLDGDREIESRVLKNRGNREILGRV